MYNEVLHSTAFFLRFSHTFKVQFKVELPELLENFSIIKQSQWIIRQRETHTRTHPVRTSESSGRIRKPSRGTKNRPGRTFVSHAALWLAQPRPGFWVKAYKSYAKKKKKKRKTRRSACGSTCCHHTSNQRVRRFCAAAAHEQPKYCNKNWEWRCLV